VFQDEGSLFNNVTFKGQKNTVNEPEIPAFVGLINHDVTNSGYVVVAIIRSKSFKTVLPS
jgi:hypothetical protein